MYTYGNTIGTLTWQHDNLKDQDITMAGIQKKYFKCMVIMFKHIFTKNMKKTEHG